MKPTQIDLILPLSVVTRNLHDGGITEQAGWIKYTAWVLMNYIGEREAIAFLTKTNERTLWIDIDEATVQRLGKEIDKLLHKNWPNRYALHRITPTAAAVAGEIRAKTYNAIPTSPLGLILQREDATDSEIEGTADETPYWERYFVAVLHYFKSEEIGQGLRDIIDGYNVASQSDDTSEKADQLLGDYYEYLKANWPEL